MSHCHTNTATFGRQRTAAIFALWAGLSLSLCSCGSLDQQRIAGLGPEIAESSTDEVSFADGLNRLSGGSLETQPATLPAEASEQADALPEPAPVSDLGVLTRFDHVPSAYQGVVGASHVKSNMRMPNMQGLAHPTPWMDDESSADEVVISDEPVECDEQQVSDDSTKGDRQYINGPLPLPLHVAGPWKPDGFNDPWPEDEYLWDGGDLEPRAEVSGDWSISGLEPEDTIVHFDTLDGHVHVQPSNRVHIYAPRFAAVRLVTAPSLEHQIDAPRGYEMKKPFGQLREAELARHSVQQDVAQRQVGRKRVTIYRDLAGWQEMSSRLGPLDFHDAFMPYENVSVIRRGKFEQVEKARLAEAIQAAVTWTGDQAAQVVIDGQKANEVVLDQQAGEVYRFDDLPGRPCLRVVKVASTHYAQPGEHVDFTIRYDNIGDETVGNVTVVDNLTTRLEYVAKSAQSSRAAEFSAQENEHGSSVLRWEIEAPLKPGDGGVVRFQCLVR